MHVDLDKPLSTKDLSKHKDIAIIHLKERWINQIWFYAALFYGALLRISPATFVHENSIGDGEIWTPDFLSTSLTRYQLSCPDCILGAFLFFS